MKLRNILAFPRSFSASQFPSIGLAILCSLAILFLFLTYGYLIIDDASDYIGLSRSFFRNAFHVDQNLEIWWPPIYYFLIAPIWSSLSYQDYWIYFIQSTLFGIAILEINHQLSIKKTSFSWLRFVSLNLFFLSIPGFIKYFMSPVPEGLFIVILLFTLRYLQREGNEKKVITLCALAYLTKYSALALLLSASWHSLKNKKTGITVALGCTVIALTWTLMGKVFFQSPPRSFYFLWKQKDFDFSGVWQFLFPFLEVLDFGASASLLVPALIIGLLGYFYLKTKSVYLLFSLFSAATHLATYFLSDPTCGFEPRLFLAIAICVSIFILQRDFSRVAYILIFLFSCVRLVSSFSNLSQEISLYSKQNLLKIESVLFLKEIEKKEGNLCLIFQNKNHASLYENSNYFRMLRFPITAKPSVTNNLRIVKEKGYKHCYLVKRHYCPNSDILCDYEFEGPATKIFTDSSKLSNGADIYKIDLVPTFNP